MTAPAAPGPIRSAPCPGSARATWTRPCPDACPGCAARRCRPARRQTRRGPSRRTGNRPSASFEPPLGRRKTTRRRRAVERLLRGCLLGGLLRAAGADTRLLAVYHRGAGERPVVRRALHLEHGVGDLQPAPGELLLQLGLVVDVARERVGDPALEGSDDCLLDGLEAVLEVDAGEAGLEQRREEDRKSVV